MDLMDKLLFILRVIEIAIIQDLINAQLKYVGAADIHRVFNISTT